MKLKRITLLIIIFALLPACKSSCNRNKEPETTISSGSLALEVRESDKKEIYSEKKKRSNIRRIEIGPSKRKIDEPMIREPESVKPVDKMVDVSLPPRTFVETDLTERLRSKLSDAYGGRKEDIPDVKIYLSEMNYPDFIQYYKGLGYKVHTVSVPASQVIEPVIDQRPELAGKIDISKYEGVIIHQVMVDEVGISAADKYIDPDTFEVIDRTFVTKVKK